MDITTWAVLPPTGASSQAAPWSTPITSPRSLPTTPPCRESRRYRSTSAEGEYLLAIAWIAIGPDDETAAAETWSDPHVVDGDTLDATNPDGTIERIRILGIDAPEWDACG